MRLDFAIALVKFAKVADSSHTSKIAAPPGNQVKDQNDQRNNQQKMNQTTSNMKAEAQ